MQASRDWVRRFGRLMCRVAFATIALTCGAASAAGTERLARPTSVEADAYCCGQGVEYAFDGNPNTFWSAGHPAPARVVVDLGQPQPITRIALLTAQWPYGATEHRIAVSNDLTSWTHVDVLKGETTDVQWLAAPVNLLARYLAITTVASESWVGWREIEIYRKSPQEALGFWDDGFANPRVRTNYNSLQEGTSADPLTIAPCLFSACPAFPLTYSAANSALHNLGGFTDSQYWVLINNNEPAYDNDCNSGPPDASLPPSLPGEGLFGFAPIMDTATGTPFYRAHLALDANFGNPCPGGIAYMSIGAHSNRGNVMPDGSARIVGALNADPDVPHTVSFVTRLYQYQRMQAAAYRLVAVAPWADEYGRDIPRMIQVNLFHDGFDDSSIRGPGVLDWNWPVREDTFYPGAEVVYFDAEDIEVLCPGASVRRITAFDANVDIAYAIDLQPLFECASQWGAWSNPMPRTPNLPITVVDWALEGQSTSGSLWVSVHGMQMQ